MLILCALSALVGSSVRTIHGCSVRLFRDDWIDFNCPFCYSTFRLWLSIAVGCYPHWLSMSICSSFLFCSVQLISFQIGKQVKSARLTLKPALGQSVLIPFTYCAADDACYLIIALIRCCCNLSIFDFDHFPFLNYFKVRCSIWLAVVGVVVTWSQLMSAMLVDVCLIDSFDLSNCLMVCLCKIWCQWVDGIICFVLCDLWYLHCRTIFGDGSVFVVFSLRSTWRFNCWFDSPSRTSISILRSVHLKFVN